MLPLGSNSMVNSMVVHIRDQQLVLKPPGVAPTTMYIPAEIRSSTQRM